MCVKAWSDLASLTADNDPLPPPYQPPAGFNHVLYWFFHNCFRRLNHCYRAVNKRVSLGYLVAHFKQANNIVPILDLWIFIVLYNNSYMCLILRIKTLQMETLYIFIKRNPLSNLELNGIVVGYFGLIKSNFFLDSILDNYVLFTSIFHCNTN